MAKKAKAITTEGDTTKVDSGELIALGAQIHTVTTVLAVRIASLGLSDADMGPLQEDLGRLHGLNWMRARRFELHEGEVLDVQSDALTELGRGLEGVANSLDARLSKLDISDANKAALHGELSVIRDVAVPHQ